MPHDLHSPSINEERAEMDELSEREIEREMKKAARDLDFERAAKLRDELKRLSAK